MTHDDVQRWLDRYVAAWKSYDPAEIGDLFSADAEYRYHPWDKPRVGRDSIVADWLAPDGNASDRDEPGTFEAAYRPWIVQGSRAVAIGTSDYFTDATRSELVNRYHNVYLLEFDAEGRCQSFIEYFIQQR